MRTNIGDNGVIELERTQQAAPWNDYRHAYRVTFLEGENVVYQSAENELSVSPMHSDDPNSEALRTVASFISAEAEKYMAYMGHREPEDGWIFSGENVAEWCYQYSDEAAMMSLEEES